MRVLMQSRINLFDLPGGDTTQVLQTKASLEARGIEVDLSLELEPDLSQYDLVHLFNVTRIQETYIQSQNARRQGKPVALSTIYWPYDEFEAHGQLGIRQLAGKILRANEIEYLKGLWRFFGDKQKNKATLALLQKGHRALQEAAIGAADIFLPNSEIEMDVFCRSFGLNRDSAPYVVVPNGVEKDFCAPATALEVDMPDGAIMCAARIETRKNQLALLRAARDFDVPLIFVGACAPNHRKYMEQLKREAGKNVMFVGRLEREQLRAVYQKARVHALVSWFETPGLASLEAGLSGCSLVVSNRGSTQEYFGLHAAYCSPTSIDSIRQALQTALNAPPSDKLQQRILQNFTWDIAAEKTLSAYRRIV